MSSYMQMASEPERFTEVIHAKITPSEAEELDKFVEFCRQAGMRVTRSSAVRAFVQSGLRAAADELKAST